MPTGTWPPPPGSPPPLSELIAGFAALAIGIAILTRHREHHPLRSPHGTRRVLFYIVAYALTSLSFMRVLAPALLGRESSPWLLALGDVLCATLALYVWVVALAERYDRRDFGLNGAPPARFALALLMGLGSVLVISFWSGRRLVMGGTAVSGDALIFALTFAILGSAVPEELLFRGLLMSSLNGRLPRWGRVALPALLFTAVRSLRFLPGLEMVPSQWWIWVFGTVLPLGLWWGLMRDLAGGSIWPGLLSHVLIELAALLSGTQQHYTVPFAP